MYRERRSHWRKLDNAAMAFPAATGKRDTRVFRFYCQLNEPVDEAVLQQALELTIDKYPLYQAVLRKGLFWFYLEHRDIPAKIHKEERPPCSTLYVPDQKSLLFEVSWHENRVNFEVFHSLTDGTGAMRFLKELIRNYLSIRYPEEIFPETEEPQSVNEYEKDSFSQYYSQSANKKIERNKAAYQLKGEYLGPDEMEVLEIELSSQAVYQQAKHYGVSVTVYLSALLLYAIYLDMPKSRLKKPITLMIPVNLRNYFPSSSMANFFGWIEAGCLFTPDTKLEDVLSHLKQVFERELSKERIYEKMNSLVSLEKNPLLRWVPLEIKNLFLLAGTTLGGKSITAIHSNLGRIQLPEIYEKYIQNFGFLASTNKMQLCTCSYKDVLKLGLTSKFSETSIQANFVKLLKQENLTFHSEENEFPGRSRHPRESLTKWLKVFSFICIAAVITCWAVDFLFTPDIHWANFVAAGVLCGWVLVMTGIKKRRNLLKNGMWQLLLISFAAVLWDFFTGWNGWSVDYVIPLAALVLMIYISALSKALRLEESEYLFYLVQAALCGCIPGILLAAKVAVLKYPSVICTGISLLLLAGIIIFKGKSLLRELHKKFRM